MVLLCGLKIKNLEDAASSQAHTGFKPSQITRNKKLD